MKQNIRITIALTLLVLMTLTADITGYREIIIPEMAALTVGFWVQDKQIWRINHWQTVMLLVIVAFTAILISKYVPFSLSLKLSMIFIIVSTILMLMNVTLTPAFAVGMLPILLGTKGFLYPIIVLILATVIVSVQYLMDLCGLHREEELHHSIRPTWHNPQRWALLLVACLPLIISTDLLGYKFCIAPPLIVAFIELANSKAGFRFRLVQTWGMLLIAAVTGTIFQVLHINYGLAEPIAICIAETLVFVMFHFFKKRFAPAAAITLIPFIMPRAMVIYFPVFAFIGATYFTMIAHLFFIKRNENDKESKKYISLTEIKNK